MARAIFRLTDPEEWRAGAKKVCATRSAFGAEEMIAQYIELYRSLGARV